MSSPTSTDRRFRARVYAWFRRFPPAVVLLGGAVALVFVVAGAGWASAGAAEHPVVVPPRPAATTTTTKPAPPPAPAPVRKLHVAGLTATTATLAWVAPYGSRGVKICGAVGSAPAPVTCRSEGLESPRVRSWTDSWLRPSTRYVFSLFAYNAEHELSARAYVRLVTSALPAPPTTVPDRAPTSVYIPPVTVPAPPPTTAAPPPVVVAPVHSSGGNPSRSIAPSTAFQYACYGDSPSISGCNQAALADIDAARASEGLGPLALPGDFYGLSGQRQIIAVMNAERTSRGLPALGENPVLDALAQVGAIAGGDPSGPSGFSWRSNYADGYATALAADFGWMYDDGPGSPNMDCSSGGGGGCWGHRDNLLAAFGGAAGAGIAGAGEGLHLTLLLVENY